MMKRWICTVLVLLMLTGCAYAESANPQMSPAIVEGLVWSRLYDGYNGIDVAEGSTRYYGLNNNTRGTKVRMYLDIQDQTMMRSWMVAENGMTVLDEQNYDTLKSEVARAVEALEYASKNIEKEGYAYIDFNLVPSDLSVTVQYLDYYAQSVAANSYWWDMCFLASKGSDGTWIRDELNVILRIRRQENSGTYLSTTCLISDQQAVWAIAMTMQNNGIELESGIDDWILRHTEAHTEEKDEGKMQVRIRESGNVNVRQQSNADSARVGSAQAGKVYPCLSIAENGWYEIQLEDGKNGYISSKMATLLQ